MVTFLISAAWISAITYVLVWMVTIAGEYPKRCCYTESANRESLKKTLFSLRKIFHSTINSLATHILL